MKTIVALTDFSPISLNAVNYAADMAKAINADLSLLHVHLVPMSFSEVPYPAEDITIILKNAEEKIQQLKNELAKNIDGRIKISAEVRTGTVISETENYCAVLEPYAIVMGTQGSSAFERVFFGNNTISAMKQLSWPLIIVPPEAKFTNIKKIGYACDLKKVATTAPLKEIKLLVKEFSAELYIIHINTESEPIYSPEIIGESSLLHEMLEELHPVYRFLSNTDIEEGLSRFTENNKIDLLIVVPKKHNIFDKLLHKSHSKKLVLHTHVPVLAVHEY